MSKLNPDKINFDNDNFLVEVKKSMPVSYQNQNMIEQEEKVDESELITNRAKDEAQKIVENAQNSAKNIIAEANNKAGELKNEIIDDANKQAEDIKAQAQQEAENIKNEASMILDQSKQKIDEQFSLMAKKGYEEGYKDAEQRILEELEQKIKDFDNFCKIQYEIKNKILKAAGKDLFDIIANISQKILLKEPEPEVLDKIIKGTITLFEKKENINLILSEKYAKILFELQKKSLTQDIELNFSEFTKYENFNVSYNSDLDDDTIIVENPKERFDASLKSQLDVIIRDILNNSNNGYLETSQYIKEDETNTAE